jgi:hypothetical protein
MPQHEQFDALGELAAPATRAQAQHSREREIEKGEEHAPMLPKPLEKHHRELKPEF